MTWIHMKGVKGLVYQPDEQPAAERKHNCKDCFCCRHCSDICCSECLKGKANARADGRPRGREGMKT